MQSSNHRKSIKNYTYKENDEVNCINCPLTHKLIKTKKENGIELLFYVCGKKTYLSAINGSSINS